MPVPSSPVPSFFPGDRITPEAVAYSYDNAWNMSGLARYSDLAETTEVAATSYTYNGHQMTGITDTNSSGTTLVSYGYTYDALGRVTQEARTWNLELGGLVGHADLRLHEQQPAHQRDAHQQLVRQRKLHLGRQRQPDGHRLYHEHGQRANRLAGV
ncbi:MAG: hypothetical protein ACLP7Q_18330 [Isosphaeraceae bacterium]